MTKRAGLATRLTASYLAILPLVRAGDVVEATKAPGVGIALIERDGQVALRSQIAKAAAPLPDPSPDALEALRSGQTEWHRIVALPEMVGDKEQSSRTAVVVVPLRKPSTARVQVLPPGDPVG